MEMQERASEKIFTFIKALSVMTIVILVLVMISQTEGAGYRKSVSGATRTITVITSNPWVIVAVNASHFVDVTVNFNSNLYSLACMNSCGQISRNLSIFYIIDCNLPPPAQSSQAPTDPHVPSEMEIAENLVNNMVWSDMWGPTIFLCNRISCRNSNSSVCTEDGKKPTQLKEDKRN